MKNTLLRTVVIFVALCIYPSIHAYDFEYDGFYYDITSDSTVSVTHDHGDFYKGDISIPNQATHNGTIEEGVREAPSPFHAIYREKKRFRLHIPKPMQDWPATRVPA